MARGGAGGCQGQPCAYLGEGERPLWERVSGLPGEVSVFINEVFVSLCAPSFSCLCRIQMRKVGHGCLV